MKTNAENSRNCQKNSVNIKNFNKYKPSDVENITLLNTLINAYISKVYDDISYNVPKLASLSGRDKKLNFQE